MSYRIMTHLIAGYPNDDIALACAQGLASGGAAYLEVQFPFSDPSADGPVIQHACQMALDGGFTTESGFQQVKRMKRATDIPLFIMSYASVVYAQGVVPFLQKAANAGADGVIIPDLMPGYDEGLYDAADRVGLAAIPVVAPGISDTRLNDIGQTRSRYLYTALRTGITGSTTELGDNTRSYLDRLAKLGKMILAGFGVATNEQVRQISSLVHAAVVGSELVRTLDRCIQCGEGNLAKHVKGVMERKIHELADE